MAGLTMYAMKPVFELDAALTIPNCMYSLPVIQSSLAIPGVGASDASCPPGALQALEARQDTILARLEKLKAGNLEGPAPPPEGSISTPATST